MTKQIPGNEDPILTLLLLGETVTSDANLRRRCQRAAVARRAGQPWLAEEELLLPLIDDLTASSQ